MVECWQFEIFVCFCFSQDSGGTQARIVSSSHGRLTEQFSLEWTSKGHLVQTQAQSRSNQVMLFRAMSSWVLKNSKNRDFTSSLGNRFQGLITLIVIFFFTLISDQNVPCFNLCPLPPVLSSCISEQYGSIFSLSSDQVAVDRNKVFPENSLFKAEQTHFSQPLFPWPTWWQKGTAPQSFLCHLSLVPLSHWPVGPHSPKPFCLHLLPMYLEKLFLSYCFCLASFNSS